MSVVARGWLAFAIALVATLPAAPAAAAPTCQALLDADYGMYSTAGDRAVGRVIERVAPRCRKTRLSEPSVLRSVRSGLGRVAGRHDEVQDTTVLDAIADALEASGAVRELDALEDIYPSRS